MDSRSLSAKAVTPKGFLFSAVEAAIKKPGRNDLAMIYSESEAVMAGMFTKNKIKAAPVKLDMERIKSGKGRVIVANSGNANACTGMKGMKSAIEIAGGVAQCLNVSSDDVFMCSTGVIGTPLPTQKILRKIPKLIGGLGKGTAHDVAAAIMTTDTFPKVASRKMWIGGKNVSITGICKGAGMICPHMATMLCFIVTDVSIGKAALGAALKDAVGKSFNRITVDGDMSTNDTVLIMANGIAGNPTITQNSREFREFTSSLGHVTYELSKMIVRDGEGATKLLEIKVINAKSRRDAERAAFAIANSLLVKTAIYGNDANWGRILAAAGYAGIAIEEDKTDIFFGKVRIVKNGVGTGREDKVSAMLREKEMRITVDLHLGKESSNILSCDLSEEYVRINAAYRT